MTAAAPRGSASYPKAQRPAQRWENRSRKQDEQESRRAGGSSGYRGKAACDGASGCRKRTLRRRFCRQIKHEVGRQLTLWRRATRERATRERATRERATRGGDTLCELFDNHSGSGNPRTNAAYAAST